MTVTNFASCNLPPADPWLLRETEFSVDRHAVGETLFALGNGYIGLRGTGEEGYAGPAGTSLDGTYLNGFYEAEPIIHPEAAYGLAKTNQFMLNVPNAKGIELYVGDEKFGLFTGKVLGFERTLDFRTGILRRQIEWESPSGKRILLVSRRVVSFLNKHLFAIEWELTPINFSGPVEIVSTINSEVKNIEAGNDPRVGSVVTGPTLSFVQADCSNSMAWVEHKTHNSGLSLVTAISNRLISSAAVALATHESSNIMGQSFKTSAERGQVIRFVKFGAYFSSRDHARDELMDLARHTLQEAVEAGFVSLCTTQAAFLADYWEEAEVEIAGDASLQQGMCFNQFHLLQSVGRDGKTNIAAKGVTGEGYEGHYFWDTEIYIFPYFLYNKPEIARQLLEYRYAGLPAARRRAREMSHASGALFPWRTIAGDECSAYFPAGTAQYHINADVAYSIKTYYEATNDLDYMARAGAEIVIETARIWIDIGNYVDGRFCINEVTGPDEYTAMVNNNCYSNTMARAHMLFAAIIATKLKEERPADYARLAEAIGLDEAELAGFADAAECMYVPYNKKLGIHEQDDTFLSKKVWDFANTPKSHYPLLMHYHPLVIYRHQVCKQADVVLALFLLSDQFSTADKKRDFDYYEAITTHDSSLSTCIFSIIAAEIGEHEKAYSYFMKTARLDLDNTHGNTHHGVHTASMAGTWLGLACGFGGMRVHSGRLRFAPILPRQWAHYKFKVHFKACALQVCVGAGKVEYTLLKGTELEFFHGQEQVLLRAQTPTALMVIRGAV
jgi:alpha,alpha-trehalose phosphorylase